MAAAIAFVVGRRWWRCPALRLKGIYLALVTLALAVIFPVARQVGQADVAHRRAGRASAASPTRNPSDWPPLPELRGREGRAIFVYWLGIVLLVLSGYPRGAAGS